MFGSLQGKGRLILYKGHVYEIVECRVAITTQTM